MPLLQPNEYNRAYFDGDIEREQGGTPHPAGYDSYKRWERYDSPTSLGEYWLDKCAGWINHLALSGKTLLELGSAKGFVVGSLRDLGVDAYGVDVSQYAYDQADPTVQPYLTVADARTYVPTLGRNAYDVILSIGLLECLTDQEAIDLATECNRVARTVVFVTYETAPSEYYNVKTIQEWANILPRKTIVVSKETDQEVTA